MISTNLSALDLSIIVAYFAAAPAAGAPLPEIVAPSLLGKIPQTVSVTPSALSSRRDLTN